MRKLLIATTLGAATILAGAIYATATATASSMRVLDGDTIELAGERVRILNIDTAELEARCPAELVLAQQARARLTDLLDDGPLDIRRIARRDRYGRTLATISVNGRDVGEVLISEGLARRWDGRRHPWCS